MPKNQQHKQEKREKKNNSLYRDIEAEKLPSKRNRNTKVEKNFQEENFLPKNLSQKLLKQVQEQQVEESEEKKKNIPRNLTLELETPDISDDEEPEHEISEIEDIDASDEATLAMFMGSGEKTTLNLGEIIMKKIREKEQQIGATPDDVLRSTLDPKVISVYVQIGGILKTYTAGKLPKAVKIIPLLSNWEEILYLTKPENWSPCAVRALTRIFASNFNEKLAEKYYKLILLPRVREDIQANKKLNWNLYMALKKSVYKPTAFFKGIILPLCEEKDCTLREAVIIGSVIKKISIPVLQSSVALLKITQMPYTAANSVFIRTLLDKNYALPYRVIDALVTHFLTFKNEERTLPVMWHQSLLSFAQKYKEDITAEQKQALKVLLHEKNHPKITNEIRRELFSTKSRGERDPKYAMDVEMES